MSKEWPTAVTQPELFAEDGPFLELNKIILCSDFQSLIARKTIDYVEFLDSSYDSFLHFSYLP